MSILRPVFNGTARVYSLSFTTSTSTGQPLETLTDTGQIISIAEMKIKMAYDVQVGGNIKLYDYRFLSERSLDIQLNIIEVNGIKYRLLTSSVVGLNTKIFGYIYTCSLY